MISIALKIGILLLVLFFVYRKIDDKSKLREFDFLLAQLGNTTIMLTLCSLLLLMLMNWLLECVKWQYLCKPIQSLSFYQSFESVFCGLSWAIFTPNRIGEYGGRVLFLKPRKRIFGVVAMAVGAFAQLIITNLMGGVALIWFLITYETLPLLWSILSCIIIVIMIIGLLLLYFRIRLLNRWISKVKWLAKIQRFFYLLERYDTKQLQLVFLLSLLRFMVFTSQYALIMLVLLPELPVVPMLMMVFLLFFIQSAIPSLDLLDVGVRSLTASLLFAYITEQELAIMASTASIWFINLIVPAIIGSVFVFKINFFGNSDR